MQVWSPEDGEDEVLVMVCRTGLNTTMGKTIRELLAPTKVSREKNPVAVVRLSTVRWQTLVSGSDRSFRFCQIAGGLHVYSQSMAWTGSGS